MNQAPARFELQTPAAPGAVALIRLEGDGFGWDRGVIGFEPPAIGGLGLRDVLGIDQALVARPDDTTLLVMPHGGAAVGRAIVERLLRHGCEPIDRGAEREPEPGDAATVERRVRAALGEAASPLAVDLLLDQPRRWREVASGAWAGEDIADGRVLRRLITPATVVAVGRPNIGKSSLLNALAGRSLALAFDRPGTTRDAVGALIDAGGLVVRWIDTPGLPEADAPGDTLADEHELVRRAIQGADLVVSCSDAGNAALDPMAILEADPALPVVHVATRADRAGDCAERCAGVVQTSAATGQGLGELVAAVREALVPASVYEDPRPWRFWLAR